MKISRMARCAAGLIAALLTAAALPFSAAADNTDYTLVEGDLQMPIPETYTLKQVIQNPTGQEGFDGLKEPEDLFINEQGYLFVADTGNNRIVKMTRQGELIAVFTGPEDSPLNSPRGVFADAEGNMYIADTGNYRILHLAADGTYVEEFGRPESDKLDEDFIFDPTKVVISPTGYIYALKGQYLITIDGYGNFRGYVGQSKIPFSLREFLVRIFASDTQRNSLRTRVAASYTNVALGPDGMLYASTLDTYEGELKKLNSIGNNIYKTYAEPTAQIVQMLTTLSFDDLSFSFGDRSLEMPNFVDVAVDDQQIMTALDSATCRLFQYDRDGNLLTIFGNKGDQNGCFQQPSSVVVDSEGCLYVLDKYKNNITVFAPTAFIQNVHAALGEYYNGDYEKASTLWQQVLATGENYQLANIGMAQAAYKQENWTEAMRQYKLAGDRLGYSEAFAKYRHSLFRGHFFLAALGAAALVILLGALVVGLHKAGARAVKNFENQSPGRYGTGNMLLLSCGVFFHPIDVMRIVRDCRGHLKARVGLILIAALAVVRVTYIYTVHYPLVEIAPRDANLVLELGKLLLPLLTFVIAAYAVTAIVGGESKLSEIFTASCFCMVPYILVYAILAPLSHLLCRSEEGMVVFLVKFTWVLIFLLFIVNVCVLNDYSGRKTIAVVLLSLFAMVLTWITILLVLSLSAQLVEFVTGFFNELRMSRL
ncbi:MAG TPA: hypothetical protein H9674_02930 [Firmicutes bacterium]|nr:hypothetical protein [Bacillota bacterium]